MQNFSFSSPTKFEFGRNAEERIGKLAAVYGRKALVHFGMGTFVKVNGILDRVINSLESAGVATVELGGAQPNPLDRKVYEAIDLCRKEKVDVIIAVGGGSVIDSAKATAIGVKYDGDFWDFFSGKAAPIEKIPLGVVLTIPAAGSEGSISSVITKEEGLLKRSCDCDLMRPEFAALNPELAATLPSYQTACGAADIIAHVMECYITNTPGGDFADRLCEATIQSVMHNTRILINEAGNYNARANVMWASMVANNDLLSVGRLQDWSSHLIEHELSGLYNVTHGAGLAVILPAFLRYQYKTNVMRIAQFGNRVFGISLDFENPELTALESIDRLEAFFREIGLPTTFKELGAKEKDIPELAAKCYINSKGELIGQFNPLTSKQVEEIYRLACE